MKRERVAEIRGSVPSPAGSIHLPRPGFSRDLTVAQALRRRQTVREIGGKKLSVRQMSNLLWAACGVNRRKGPFALPGRTAASASNSQEIDLYVLTENAVYLYDPVPHRLVPVASGDYRVCGIGSGQATMGGKAPVTLIFVADIRKLTRSKGFQEPGLHNAETQKAYYFVDTGLIAGNVYLHAASQGLAAWFHNCNKPALTKALGLRAGQRVLFGQSVGYRAGK